MTDSIPLQNNNRPKRGRFLKQNLRVVCGRCRYKNKFKKHFHPHYLGYTMAAFERQIQVKLNF